MKNIFFVLAICLVYFGISVATSKTVDSYDVCYPQLDAFLWNDTNVFCFRKSAYDYHKDSIFFIVHNVNDALQKAPTICKTLKDSCSVTNQNLIFIDTSNVYDTSLKVWGKIIYTTKCP